MYEELIQQVKIGGSIQFLDAETIKNVVHAIQRKCIEINDWIRTRLKGKRGLLRGGLLSKTIDYSGRLNIVGDPSLKLGYVGLPWQVVLKLYEPFTIYQILKNSFNLQTKELIHEFIGKESKLDSSALKRFIAQLNDQPDMISNLLKDELIRIANIIVQDKVVLIKRDPVENRDSYVSAFVRVDDNSFVAKLQTLDTVRMGADFDGDTIGIYPLFTKKANEEAMNKMNPRLAKSMWKSPLNVNNVSYQLSLDSVATVYSVTKY